VGTSVSPWLPGKGVHIVTVNDYLARRDCEWIGQVHKFLGLKCGLIQSGMTEAERREGYGSVGLSPLVPSLFDHSAPEKCTDGQAREENAA
jgi:hypothetical protein